LKEGFSVMKKIALIYLLCIWAGAHAPASGQTISKCFRADWLQGERIIRLEINGNKVSGAFLAGDGSGVNQSAYNFSGTRRGNVLTVAFAGNKLPDVSPSEMKSLVWTLVQARGKESLRIKFSGKNYDTNKFEESIASFESCDATPVDNRRPGYAELAKTAQTIRFAKGKNSASVPLGAHAGLQKMKAPATFLLHAAKSQTLDITAHGCTIEVYLPNRKLYQYVEWEGGNEKTYASTGLDRMSIEALPATGAYLIVLRKPNEVLEPETLTVTVKK
jgi:hypothetical protein